MIKQLNSIIFSVCPSQFASSFSLLFCRVRFCWICWLFCRSLKCLLFVTFLHFHIFCIIPYSGLWSIHSTNSCLCRHCCPKRCVCFMRNFLWICHHESPVDSFLTTFSSSRLNFKQYFFKRKTVTFPLNPCCLSIWFLLTVSPFNYTSRSWK